MNRLTLIRSFCFGGVLLGMTSTSSATGDILDAFLNHYQVPDTSALAESSCAVCHVSDSDLALNPFGTALQAALEEGVATDKTWTAVETADSDGDGVPNGEEIAANTLPGDAASGGKEGVTPPADTAAPKKEKPLVPKNGWHPAIVHFPIALFIGGLILDFLGMIRKDKTLLQAGWYNIIMAAITALAGVASGVLAMTLMKLPYRGLIFNHLIWAIASTAIIWILVALRVDRHEKINFPLRIAYYILATIALFSISWAGHLGGEFVYG